MLLTLFVPVDPVITVMTVHHPTQRIPRKFIQIHFTVLLIGTVDVLALNLNQSTNLIGKSDVKDVGRRYYRRTR